MTTPMSVEFDLHITCRGHSARQELREGPAPPRVPRVPSYWPWRTGSRISFAVVNSAITPTSRGLAG